MHHQIIEEARSWLGTGFCHQGRTKKTEAQQGGCDCLGLIMGIARKLELKSRNGSLIVDLDRRDYQAIPPSDLLMRILEEHCIRIEQPQPGAIALLSFLDHPQHLAIIATQNYNDFEEFTIIHAYQTVGKVCEHIFDKKWQRRAVAFYSFF